MTRHPLQAVALAALMALTLLGAKALDPICTWTPTLLSLVNMDPDVPFAITMTLYPVGTTTYPNADGTWSITGSWGGPETAYVWVRGHGPSLLKPGPGLNDYHVVAICELAAG